VLIGMFVFRMKHLLLRTMEEEKEREAKEKIGVEGLRAHLQVCKCVPLLAVLRVCLCVCVCVCVCMSVQVRYQSPPHHARPRKGNN
jgi:hypothetical protein